MSEASKTIRINKYIASSGYCSRRAADELISSGKIMVNNIPCKEMGTQIDPAVDEVRIKGGPVIKPSQETMLVIMNKPKGYTCTKADEHAARTVYELLPDHLQHLKSIGRLDRDSEGLLLFTNDGNFANKMGHPKFGKKKVYHVTVRGAIVEKDLLQMRKGMRLIEYTTAPAEAEVIRWDAKEKRTTLEITLKEGKKRQIRNMFLALKKPVKKLVRVRFGKFGLGKMKPGEYAIVSQKKRDM